MNKPYIIAEIETPTIPEGKELIDVAHQAGADAIKVQYYKAGHLVAKDSPWWPIYQQRERSLLEIDELCRYTKSKDMDFGVSIFTPEIAGLFSDVDFLKIAAPEALDFALIDAAVKTGKRVYVSVSSSMSEADTATLWERYSETEVTFLYCSSGYPAHDPDYALNLAGVSDHSCGQHGLTQFDPKTEVIEKHLGRVGNDQPWVVHPDHFADWVRAAREGVKETPLTFTRSWVNGEYLRTEGGNWDMREPEQLELFEPVPEQPKPLDLKGAMIDTALQELLEHFSWEDIERAIERLKRDA